MINNNYLAMLTRQTDEYSPMGFVYRALADFDDRLRYLESEISDATEWIKTYCEAQEYAEMAIREDVEPDQ